MAQAKKKSAKQVLRKTNNQERGDRGERYVVDHCICPRCKRIKTLKQLRTNFKCADIICDFCGFLGQVKTNRVADITKLPKTITAAAWDPQRKRLEAGIYFSLFIVLVDKLKPRKKAIYFLSSELQRPDMFVPRNPLSSSARRSGWVGFNYDLSRVPSGAIVCLKQP